MLSMQLHEAASNTLTATNNLPPPYRPLSDRRQKFRRRLGAMLVGASLIAGQGHTLAASEQLFVAQPALARPYGLAPEPGKCLIMRNNSAPVALRQMTWFKSADLETLFFSSFIDGLDDPKQFQFQFERDEQGKYRISSSTGLYFALGPDASSLMGEPKSRATTFYIEDLKNGWHGLAIASGSDTSMTLQTDDRDSTLRFGPGATTDHPIFLDCNLPQILVKPWKPFVYPPHYEVASSNGAYMPEYPRRRDIYVSIGNFQPPLGTTFQGYPFFHVQHVVRLPNKGADAYFALTQSNSDRRLNSTPSPGGALTIFKVPLGADDEVDFGRRGEIVRQFIFDKTSRGRPSDCDTDANAPGCGNPIGAWNHPAKMAVVGNTLAVVAQSWEASVCCLNSDGYKHSDPDAVLFFDISDPAYPMYVTSKFSNGRKNWIDLLQVWWTNKQYFFEINNATYRLKATDSTGNFVELHELARTSEWTAEKTDLSCLRPPRDEDRGYLAKGQGGMFPILGSSGVRTRMFEAGKGSYDIAYGVPRLVWFFNENPQWGERGGCGQSTSDPWALWHTTYQPPTRDLINEPRTAGDQHMGGTGPSGYVPSGPAGKYYRHVTWRKDHPEEDGLIATGGVFVKSNGQASLYSMVRVNPRTQDDSAFIVHAWDHVDSSPSCGNGIVEADEACDYGRKTRMDSYKSLSCNASCKVPAASVGPKVATPDLCTFPSSDGQCARLWVR